MKNKFNVKLNELPLRERKLTKDELTKVFGGEDSYCKSEDFPCGTGVGSCCDGLTCQPSGIRMGGIIFWACVRNSGFTAVL